MSDVRSPLLRYATLLLILLWVTLAGARQLQANLFFSDEVFSVAIAGAPPYGPVDVWTIVERTIDDDFGGMGVAYYVPLGIWTRFVGGSLLAVRAFSLLFAVLSVAMTYRLAADLGGSAAGLAAALLLSVCAFLIFYSHEARAYSAFVFLAAFSVWCYVRLKAHFGWGWLIALLVSLTVLLYLHYVALAMLAILLGDHLLAFRRRHRWGVVLIALVGAGIAYLPWLPVNIWVANLGIAYSRAGSAMSAVQIPIETASAFSNANLIFLLVILALGVTAPLREKRLLIVWVVGGVGLVMLVNALIPFAVGARYLVFIFPALALLGGCGVVMLWRRGVPRVLLVGSIAVVGVGQTLNPAYITTQHDYYYRTPAAGMLQGRAYLRQYAAPEDALLFHIMPPGLENPFGGFTLGDFVQGIPHRIAEQIGFMNASDAQDDNSYLAVTQNTLQDAPRVWTLVIPELAHDNHFDVVNYVLDTEFMVCAQVFDLPNLNMRLYARPTTAAAEVTFSNATDAVGVHLLHIRQQDGLFALLQFDAVQLPLERYSVSIHLQDASGVTVRQQDFGMPQARPAACQAFALPYAGLPAGDYAAVVYVYDWQTGIRLETTGAAWQMVRFSLDMQGVASPISGS